MNSVSIDPPKLSINLLTIHVDRSTQNKRKPHVNSVSISDILQPLAVTSPEHLYLDFYQNIRFRLFLTVRCDQNGTTLTIQTPIKQTQTSQRRSHLLLLQFSLGFSLLPSLCFLFCRSSRLISLSLHLSL
jgi:hypothetical protein